jgi:dihydrofolate synthase / folylpolyglutamate synthase
MTSARSSPATVASSMPSAVNTAWLETLSPWPEEFGLARMHKLLAALGKPQEAYRAIHVVGTNGKTTTARTTEALLTAEGLYTGTYTSPHVLRWAERVRVGGEEADLERALARVRPPAETLGATQFEVLTAAALAVFAEAVDVAIVEAGLGGRLDATNVLRAPVVVLTNVALEHTEQLGETREEIAREKLAVVSPGAFAVLGEAEWEAAARKSGAAGVVVAGPSNLALALAAAETFLGRTVDASAAEGLVVPGRLERVAEAPLEIWDGAHNLAAVGHLLARLPRADYVLVVSMLADKDAGGMLAALSPLGDRLVATSSSNPRALPAAELARVADPFFARIETVAEPAVALARAREAAGASGAVLVTGSLYLLADLASVRSSRVPWQASASG